MTNEVSQDLLPYLAASMGADYADSFAACRELLATMFDLEAASPEVRAAYVMDFALYDYGPIKLGMSRASAPTMWRPSSNASFSCPFWRRPGTFAA